MTRTPDTAPSTDLIAEAEANCHPLAWALVERLITALRAAEARADELDRFVRSLGFGHCADDIARRALGGGNNGGTDDPKE